MKYRERDKVKIMKIKKSYQVIKASWAAHSGPDAGVASYVNYTYDGASAVDRR